jgi:lipid-A-disaccharide synthase
MRIGMVAGEVSGDLLGAGLLQALKARVPDLQCEGICGGEMMALGARSLFPMEKLAVMGLVEVVGRYREIKRIRDDLIAHFLANPPDLFIGIDAPDFNLGVEEVLRRAGIPTVQYVSPQVWAWRGYRIRKIRRAVDHMLTLFPFEERYYRDHQVPVTFVGHPMADQIPDNVDRDSYRDRLKLPHGQTVIALLPGSRLSELKAHADLFVQTAAWLYERHPQFHFVIPFVSRPARLVFEEAVKRQHAWDLPITRLFGHGRDAMAAADIVIAASGTATLEAALLKRLLIVTYKMAPLTAALIRLFSHVKLYSLPNNLAGEAIVPELLQGDAVPEKLGEAVEHFLANPARAKVMYEAYGRLHRQLRQNASERAAEAVLELVRAGGTRAPLRAAGGGGRP